jgi:hypothetical protein
MLARILSCRLNAVPFTNANLKAKLLTVFPKDSYLAFPDFKNNLIIFTSIWIPL